MFEALCTNVLYCVVPVLQILCCVSVLFVYFVIFGWFVGWVFFLCLGGLGCVFFLQFFIHNSIFLFQLEGLT